VPIAREQAKSGRLSECRLFVDGYWPSFLRRHVQLPDGREMPSSAAAGPVGAPPVVGGIQESAPIIEDQPANRRRPARGGERNSWLPSWLRWK
jgi:hypothetical protein